MATAYLALGSNLGSREAFLRAALALLRAEPALEVERESPLYLTAPFGPPQPDYLNAAARLRTSLSPPALLSATQRIEQRLLRARTVKNGPRTLDLDLLSHDDVRLDDPALVLPHPRMRERPFVLAPRLDLDDDATLRAALADAGGPPPRHRPAAIRTTPDGFTVRALDAADALAFALGRAFGPPATLDGTELVEADSASALFASVAARGAGMVVVVDASPPIRALRIGCAAAPLRPPRSVTLDGPEVQVSW